MDFILNEAEVEDDQYKLVFSDDDDEAHALSASLEDQIFIDDSSQGEQESRHFYRDLNNRDNYVNFHNQTRNPVEVVDEVDDEEYYGEDDMPELYDPENREDVNFDFFANDQVKAKRFKDNLVCFPNVQNHFSYAIMYGLMHDKLKRQQIELDKAKETLGDEPFFGLKQVEGSVMLDHSLFGYFDRCRLVNDILAKHNYFLRFYERRNKFRYQLRQKLKTKNEMRRELSSCTIQKFNG